MPSPPPLPPFARTRAHPAASAGTLARRSKNAGEGSAIDVMASDIHDVRTGARPAKRCRVNRIGCADPVDFAEVLDAIDKMPNHTVVCRRSLTREHVQRRDPVDLGSKMQAEQTT